MRYDTIIIGGSFAGLAAALYLARSTKSVCIVDDGKPRNRFAEQAHGLFAQDGNEPKAMLATMREQVAAYPEVDFVSHPAVAASKELDSISVELDDGTTVLGSRLLLAFGITDILPDLPGLAERWGKSVVHCPYCHGYEFKGKQLGVLYLSPTSLHQGQLIPEWGPTTLYLNGMEIDPARLADLQSRGVMIEPTRLDSLIGDGTSLSEVRLADGRSRSLEALFIGPRNRLNSDIAATLGCAIGDGPLGPAITVDGMKSTTVANVYAAGDITGGAQNITFACADGVMAGMAIHRSLFVQERSAAV